jgi:hypothetical protein
VHGRQTHQLFVLVFPLIKQQQVIVIQQHPDRLLEPKMQLPIGQIGHLIHQPYVKEQNSHKKDMIIMNVQDWVMIHKPQ